MTILVARSGDVGGTPFKEYYATLDMAKELAMLSSITTASLTRKR